MSSTSTNSLSSANLLRPFLAGACAGLAVDISLFPIDTIKTRLQSPAGFWASGGFSRIYLGIGSTVSGSAPGAALFFFTYESTKNLTAQHLPGDNYQHLRYMISAAFGETIACLVRVPVEVVKQRAQAFNISSGNVLRETLSKSGFGGLYRGYSSTLMREIPFSLVQFPLWEHLKSRWSKWQGSPILPYQSMICGSIAGGISAFVTTPLDVAKTNIMLQDFRDSKSSSASVDYYRTIKSIYSNKGIPGLFAGAVPRVMWISIGGAIFLGGYEKVSSFFREYDNLQIY